MKYSSLDKPKKMSYNKYIKNKGGIQMGCVYYNQLSGEYYVTTGWIYESHQELVYQSTAENCIKFAKDANENGYL